MSLATPKSEWFTVLLCYLWEPDSTLSPSVLVSGILRQSIMPDCQDVTPMIQDDSEGFFAPFATTWLV